MKASHCYEQEQVCSQGLLRIIHIGLKPICAHALYTLCASPHPGLVSLLFMPSLYMVMLSVLNNPVLTLQLGILGKLLGLMGRIVKGCVREVSLAQVSCILMYVYVAPPTPVGAWSMALGLRQRFEYYYYAIPIFRLFNP